MDEKKILLINLSKGRLGRHQLALTRLDYCRQASYVGSFPRGHTGKREKRLLSIHRRVSNVTTDSIATILSEARKYKLNLTIAHQFIGQLEENIKKAVFGNVGSMGAFRIGAEDGEFLAKQFEPVFDAGDLLNIDNYRAYLKLLVEGQSARPFNIATLPFQKAILTSAKKRLCCR